MGGSNNKAGQQHSTSTPAHNPHKQRGGQSSSSKSKQLTSPSNNYFDSDEVFWNNIQWDANPRLQNHANLVSSYSPERVYRLGSLVK